MPAAAQNPPSSVAVKGQARALPSRALRLDREQASTRKEGVDGMLGTGEHWGAVRGELCRCGGEGQGGWDGHR